VQLQCMILLILRSGKITKKHTFCSHLSM
jgi:hypothetical protein